MELIKTIKPTAFDVDETLVHQIREGEKVDPGAEIIEIGGANWIINRNHVTQLEYHAARGHTIIVWSQGGGEGWAKEVVKALDLEDKVDYVMCKPYWMYDDNVNWPTWIYLDLKGKNLYNE